MRNLFIIAFILQISISAHSQLTLESQSIKTYDFGDPSPLPSILYNKKIYPFNSFDGYSLSSELKKFNVIKLENDYITVEVLPDLGGKIWGAIDKSNGNEFIYKNDVVKYRNIAMRGPWTSGGIEFNFGIIGHHPSTASAVDYRIEELEDGTMICTVGTIDLPSRTHWRVKIILPKNQSAFKTEALWFNPTSTDKAYYNWMTAAAVAKSDLTFYAPGNTYLEHNGNPHPWPYDKLGRNLSNYNENDFGSSKSYHVVGEYNDFFAGYYSESNVGFGHFSRYDEMPGKKLWIWDLSRFGGIWEDLLTDTDGQYIEYQAGRLFDQYSPGVENALSQASFDASRADKWEEYWFPVKNLNGIKEASSKGAMNAEIIDEKLVVKINSFIEKDVRVILSQNKNEKVRDLKFLPNGFEQITFDDFTSTEPFTITIPELELTFKSVAELIKRPWTTDSSIYGIASSDKVFQKGLNARRFREFDSAKSFFTEVLADDPAHLGALEEMGKLYFEQGLFKHAERFINIGLSIDTYHPGLNYIAGLNYQFQEDYTNALESYGWAAHSLQFRSASYANMSQIHLLTNNYTEALHYSDLALRSNSLNFNALAFKYLSLIQLDRNEEALSTLDILSKNDPLNHFVAFERYNLNLINLEEHQSYHRSEYPFQTYLELALFYHSLGNKKKAMDVLNLSPKHSLITLHRAYLEKDKRLLSSIADNSISYVFPFRLETLNALNWAQKHHSNWKFDYLKALNLYGLNRDEEAIKLLNNLGDAPDEANFYWIRGHVNPIESLNSFNDFERAFLSNKKDWRYALSYANSLLTSNKVSEAIDVLNGSFKHNRLNYSLGLKLAEAYVKLKAYDQAISLFDELEVLPYEHAKGSRKIYTDAYVRRAAEMFEKGDHDQSIKLLTKALEWPENLGVGKPFDAEERVIRFMLALITDPEKGQLELNQVALYSTKQLEPGKKENLLGLYAIEMTNGKNEALLFAQHLDKVASNANEKDVVDDVLAFYLSHPVKTIKDVTLSKILDFIDN